MNTTSFSLGPVPCEESCEQLGENYNAQRALNECSAYINQLRRMFGNPPKGVYYRISSNRHDFGTYHEVELEFPQDDEIAEDFCLNIENNSPTSWDDEAKQELGITDTD